MVGVILAAGNGTRFGSSSFCKVLNRINNITLIELALNHLVQFGIHEAYIVVGKHADRISGILGCEYSGIQIHYVHQPKQLGLINALVQALPFLPEGEDVCLQLADEVFFDLKTEAIKDSLAEMGFDVYCGITIEENPEKIMQNYSVEVSGTSRITRCVEKPTSVPNNMKGTGMCFFRHSTLQMLGQIYDTHTGAPCDLCDFLNYLIAAGRTVTALLVAEKEININTPADLEEAVAFGHKLREQKTKHHA